MTGRCFHWLLLLLVPFDAFADDPGPVRYLGIEHGLSNNAVTCIYRDHNGFMWFGTYDGLNRYDGYQFKVFRNVIGDSNSLRDNHVFIIESDPAHHLWIGGPKGISIYDPALSRFSSPRFINPKSGKSEAFSGGAGMLKWINNGSYMLAGAQSDGLFVFEKKKRVGLQIPFAGFKGHETEYGVNAIDEDLARNRVWVFVEDAGLCRYDARKKQLILVNPAIRGAACMKVDYQGNVWVGNSFGLFKYDVDRDEYSANLMPSRNRVVGLFEDKRHTMWIASDGGGVLYCQPGAPRALAYRSHDGQSLVNSNAVYAVYEDDKERKWVGTLRGGINLIEPRTNSFRHISLAMEPKNLVSDFILSFCEDEKNNIWIGTDGAGLRYWNRGENTFSRFTNQPADNASISSDFITGILRDSRNDIWVSTWFGGVNRFKKESGTFQRLACYNPYTKLEENNAWLMYEDKRRRIWASTSNNGTLYLFNQENQRFEIFDNSIVNVQCLAEDSAGNFWGGNYNSLIRIDRDQRKHKSYFIGYPVRSIHEDKKKNFWVGTEGGGLLLFDRASGSYQRLTTANGLPNNSILRILEDKKGNLWMSTYNGLCRLNTETKVCRNFSQSDGLQSNQFSFNAALSLQGGEFLFGGIKGFNVFYPDSILDIRESPTIFLTGLKINNRPVEEDGSFVTKRRFEMPEELTLPFDKAILSLDFVALEYSGADKIKYAYKLEGWDKDWNDVNNLRTANYSRLQEGNYKFKVKVTNADGLWSEEAELLRIRVLPPWFRTWWAYLSFGLLAVSGVYIYIRYNKRQERLRYEIKLAHIEKENEKQLAERKINFFTHISHEFRTPLTLIINPLRELIKGNLPEKEVRKDVSMVYRNARRLLSLVDQLLLFRKVESVDQQMHVECFDIGEVCGEVYLSFGQHAAAKNIDFELDDPEGKPSIYADKEKIEIILYNLVSNAFKYTEAGGKISMGVREDEKQVTIRVRDSGSGIPADVGNRLFDSFYQVHSRDKASQPGFGIGLYVSQQLAKAHSGTLTYESIPGEGTEFRLVLLKGKSHFSPQVVSEEHVDRETILHELVEEPSAEQMIPGVELVRNSRSGVIDKLTSGLPSMLIVDDNREVRDYVRGIFADSYIIYEAGDGEAAYELCVKEAPDIVISDVMMPKVGGIELCGKIKNNPAIAHIPVILLTASSSDEARLKGVEHGSEDYIIKPFDRDLIVARVKAILKGRNRLQQYFFDAVTLKPNAHIAGEHKEFIERCISIVERHLDNPDFNIQVFCREIGMSHPSLYKKVKAVSGLTVNVFVRYLRLRKAAELLISTDKTIVEITYITGFNDIRYFREQFHKLFQLNPSEYVKRYRKVLGGKANG